MQLSDKARAYLRGCVLVLVGALTYANSLSGPMLFDDASAILNNPQIRALWPLVEALNPPRDGVLAARPIVNLSFAINYAIGGVSVGGYHLVNVGLHILSALVLFGIIRNSLRTPKLRDRFATAADSLALACALVWMVHPLLTESVDYLTQRTELMMGLFYLLTLYCAIRGAAAGAPDRWHLAAIVCCLLGMGSKESMVTAPVIVLVYDRIFIFDSVRAAWTRRKRLYAGLTLGWLELAALITSRAHTVGFSAGVPAWTYLLNQAQMVTQYLKLTLWPHALVLDYGLPRSLVLMDVLPQATVVVALVALTAMALVMRPMIGFLGAWFFITLAPASSVVPIVTEVGAERRMYLPLIGVVVLVVVGAHQLLAKGGARRVKLASAVAALSIVVVALASATMRRNHDYASGVSLLRTTVERWPHGRAEFNLATVLKQEGKLDEALAYLRASVPDNPESQYALGSELYDRGDFDGAIKQLREFIARTSRNNASSYSTVAARNLVALSLAQQGKFADAVEEFHFALRLDPDNANLHGNLAFILLQQKDFEGARQHYEKYLQRHAGSAFVLTNLGVALEALGRVDSARERFREALAIDPNYGEARRRFDRANHPTP
jgi:protein O-mannosyl-transferase